MLQTLSDLNYLRAGEEIEQRGGRRRYGITYEDRVRAVKLNKEKGVSAKQLARIYGIDYSTAKDWVRKGLEGIPRRTSYSDGYSARYRERAARETIFSGLTAAEVSRTIGVGYGSLLSWCLIDPLDDQRTKYKFPPGFQRQAARWSLMSTLPIEEQADTLEVSVTSLRRWRTYDPLCPVDLLKQFTDEDIRQVVAHYCLYRRFTSLRLEDYLIASGVTLERFNEWKEQFPDVTDSDAFPGVWQQWMYEDVPWPCRLYDPERDGSLGEEHLDADSDVLDEPVFEGAVT